MDFELLGEEEGFGALLAVEEGIEVLLDERNMGSFGEMEGELVDVCW